MHLGMKWIVSFGSAFVFSTIDNQEIIYPYIFAFNFSGSMCSITFQCVLTSAIKRKITLAGDACSRPPIIIRFHDLHSGDIRRAMSEINSYHEKA